MDYKQEDTKIYYYITKTASVDYNQSTAIKVVKSHGTIHIGPNKTLTKINASGTVKSQIFEFGC